MESQTVTLRLPTLLLQAAQDIANQRNETISKVIEDLLARDLVGRSAPKKTERKNHGKIFALQSLLFNDMAAATGWNDLTLRLLRHGYWMKLSYGGLTIHTQTSGRCVCLAEDLGFGYRTFLRRFGTGLPGHPHDVLPRDLPALQGADDAPSHPSPLNASVPWAG